LLEHLESLDNYMDQKTKKIVLLIVEGDSDKLALGPILSHLIPSIHYKFKVTHGDVTSDYENNVVSNIEIRICEIVSDFLGHVYEPSDLQEIIHIIDTDGSFISPHDVLYKNVDKINYTNTVIETKFVSKIQMRNSNKASILKHLSSITKISFSTTASQCFSIPYCSYYMSSNLDHVLYNNQNLEDEKKIPFANQFADSYFGRERDFIAFMNDSNIFSGLDYKRSWLFLRKSNHSLIRGSNFAIYLNTLN